MLDSARDLDPEFIVTFLAEKCECHKISSLFWQKSVNMAIFKILAEKCECQKKIRHSFFAVNLVRLLGELAICTGSCRKHSDFCI